MVVVFCFLKEAGCSKDEVVYISVVVMHDEVFNVKKQ